MSYEIKTPILKRIADLAMEVMTLALSGEIADQKLAASVNRKISQAERFFKKGDLHAAHEVLECAEAEVAQLKRPGEFGDNETAV